MYIEELEIDRFLQQVHEYENMDDEQKFDAEEPQMSATVEKYFELGELFLDDEDETDSVSDPDVMSVAPDLFG